MKFWHIVSMIISIIAGTLLHFAYEYSGNVNIVGIFAPVSESIFEHLKLVLTPIMIMTIIEYFLYGKNINGFVFIRFLAALIGMIFIVVSYYTYTGIIGHHFLFADIMIFIVSVILAYIFSYYFISKNSFNGSFYNILGVFLFVIITIIFAALTFMPFNIPFFY